MKNDLKILVCYYKDLLLKPSDEQYFLLQCGADDTKIDLGIIPDSTGDNISSRNRYWSEITGLYWAWKNIPEVKYVGLCSYRRFFNFKHNPGAPIKILPISSHQEIEKINIPNLDEIFEKFDVILPQAYTYAYNAHKVCQMNYNMEDFDILENLIKERTPQYLNAYKKMFYGTNMQIGHNMFIMKWDDFQEYCEWVFSILLEAEKLIDPVDYPIHQVRVFGYMHEILLAVYIEKKKFRSYNSQLTWLSNNSKGFKFNALWYRILANLYYAVTKPFNKR